MGCESHCIAIGGNSLLNGREREIPSYFSAREKKKGAKWICTFNKNVAQKTISNIFSGDLKWPFKKELQVENLFSSS